MIRPIQLKNVIIPNNLFLAPLAGYTDAAMRRLCREAGAGLTITEMVSAKGLLYNNKNTGELLQITSPEKPCSAQLFGSEPEVFGEVIKNSELLAPFDIIDINMGCPVRKIVSSGEGSALLYDIKKAAMIVNAAAKATTKPITVKIRIPDKTSGITLSEAVHALTESGAALIAIHGRTAKMMYGGKADWNIINEAATNSRIPVIGNGDIATKEEALQALSGACSGIMIGRGAIGNPSIFSQILETAKHSLMPTSYKSTVPRYFSSIKEIALKHIEYSNEYYGEHYTILNMRKHLGYYVKGMPSMREFKNKINYATSTEDLKELIHEYIKQ